MQYTLKLYSAGASLRERTRHTVAFLEFRSSASAPVSDRSVAAPTSAPKIATTVACHTLARYCLSSRSHNPALPSRRPYHIGQRTRRASTGVGSGDAFDIPQESHFFWYILHDKTDNIPARLLWRDDKEEKNKKIVCV